MKEQSEKLFRAIGDVGDDLIAQADAPVKKAPRVWVKWAALAACCALVIGAAAFVVPMFHAGSSAPEAASAPTADTANIPGRARGAENSDASGRGLLHGRAGERYTHVGRFHADKRRRRCACTAQRILAGNTDGWRVAAADVESDEVSEPDGRIRAGIDRLHTAL